MDRQERPRMTKHIQDTRVYFDRIPVNQLLIERLDKDVGDQPSINELFKLYKEKVRNTASSAVQQVPGEKPISEPPASRHAIQEPK